MATKAEILHNFDSSDIGVNNGSLLGLPFDYESANCFVLLLKLDGYNQESETGK